MNKTCEATLDSKMVHLIPHIAICTQDVVMALYCSVLHCSPLTPSRESWMSGLGLRHQAAQAAQAGEQSGTQSQSRPGNTGVNISVIEVLFYSDQQTRKFRHINIRWNFKCTTKA